jgi:hypothetical protein
VEDGATKKREGKRGDKEKGDNKNFSLLRKLKKSQDSSLNNFTEHFKVSGGESGRFSCLAGQIRKKAAQSLLSRVALTFSSVKIPQKCRKILT